MDDWEFKKCNLGKNPTILTSKFRDECGSERWLIGDGGT